MNQQKDKGWWGRNWKWFVPVGCLGSLAIFAGFIALIICLVFGMMKSSGVYKDALAKAKADPSVQKIIGTPIEEGMFVTGNINVNGSSGQADLSIPISGPDGKATVYVVAAKSAGQWTFSTLVVEIKETNQRIDLLE
ncbi:cytochrome c oxidase assembly factor Coa1 family protein [Verrucomicrobiota bacterium]